MSAALRKSQKNAVQEIKSPKVRVLPPLKAAKRKKILTIDLGKWTTKAVYMEAKGDEYKLLNYAVQPSLPFDPEAFRDGLPELLINLHRATGAQTKRVVISLSMGDVILRSLDMPNAKVSDLRKILKLNPQLYSQEDLKEYIFDCCVFNTAKPQNSEIAAPASTMEDEPKLVVLPNAARQVKVLVGGAMRRLVNDLQEGCAKAGLILEEVTLSQISLINAATSAMGQKLNSQVSALIDIGFRTSTISILVNGEVALTRVVSFGGDQLTSELAKEMEANYRVAEGIKVSLSDKVPDKLKGVLATLCHELRKAIDFFENQYELTVTEALICGASARSKFLVEVLESQMMLSCKTWNPADGLDVAVPSNLRGEMELSSPQLGSAIGAALTWLSAARLNINLLAEKQEEAEQLRRDPVRWTLRAATFLVVLMLGWATLLVGRYAEKNLTLLSLENRLAALSKTSHESDLAANRVSDIQKTLQNLQKLSDNRFQWAGALNALQHTIVDNVEVVRVQLKQNVVTAPASKATKKTNGSLVPGKPATQTEEMVLLITLKNYGGVAAAQRFINSIGASAYFKLFLQKDLPVRIIERTTEGPDVLEPEKISSLYTLALYFTPRITTE